MDAVVSQLDCQRSLHESVLTSS